MVDFAIRSWSRWPRPAPTSPVQHLAGTPALHTRRARRTPGQKRVKLSCPQRLRNPAFASRHDRRPRSRRHFFEREGYGVGSCDCGWNYSTSREHSKESHPSGRTCGSGNPLHRGKMTLLPRLELTVHLLHGSGAGRQSGRHRRPVLEPTDSANYVVRERNVADSGSGPDRTGAVDADRLAREATHDYARHCTSTLFGAWISPPARSPGCAYRVITLRSSSSSSNTSLAPTRSESCIW